MSKAGPEPIARRDVLMVGAQSFAAIGAAASLWPFVDQMNPHAGSQRLDHLVVELGSIAPGETRLVRWRGRPVFVRNRTEAEFRQAEAADPRSLPDRLSRNAALDAMSLATDANRTLPTHRNWLVVIGSCTHLGCLLRSHAQPERSASGLGWICPCHAARFDLSGRVLSGPARTNLPVPRFKIVGRQMVVGVS